ncbi:hypothetical protein A6A04_20190 [Paramagnetospirillum marisnigri]|uniref:Uncharacterized protein n=1 Tax=Paramagnetospirillum marisnigri TaxID=1285242 RepID=A0A178MI90_9PROT|nr:hypothetical protein A6A04_20190 [Paramagnetospirillum marisnigri]
MEIFRNVSYTPLLFYLNHRFCRSIDLEPADLASIIFGQNIIVSTSILDGDQIEMTNLGNRQHCVHCTNFSWSWHVDETRGDAILDGFPSFGVHSMLIDDTETIPDCGRADPRLAFDSSNIMSICDQLMNDRCGGQVGYWSRARN